MMLLNAHGWATAQIVRPILSAHNTTLFKQQTGPTEKAAGKALLFDGVPLWRGGLTTVAVRHAKARTPTCTHHVTPSPLDDPPPPGPLQFENTDALL